MEQTKDVVDFSRITPPSNDVSDAVMSIQFTPDMEWCACAISNGMVNFYSGQRTSTFRPFGLGDNDGLTGISFCKDYNDEGEQNAYWMTARSSSGILRAFEVVPGRIYKSLGEAQEQGNEILCSAFSDDRRYLVSGGSDTILRLYVLTEDGLKFTQKFEQGIDEHGAPSIGHASRIFAIKFLPDNACFLSAGWESSVLLYDTRAGNVPQRQFQGPRVSGDGLDFSGNLLACASDRLTQQLQFYDLGSGQKIGEDVSFNSNLYSVKLSKRKGQAVAWVSGAKENMVSCVDVKTRKVTTVIKGMEEAMFCLDVNDDRPGQLFAGGGCGAVYRLAVAE